MDKKFGVGVWRSLVRFAVWQGGVGKWRVIDDARISELNEAASSEEHIHTTCTDFGILLAKVLWEELRPTELEVSIPDMKRAFKQIPSADEDLPFSVTAVWCPSARAWRFGLLHTLAFGQSNAVVGFNRVPAFLVAAARRLLAIPCTHFYDNFKVLDARGGGVLTSLLNRCLILLSRPFCSSGSLSLWWALPLAFSNGVRHLVDSCRLCLCTHAHRHARRRTYEHVDMHTSS